MTDLITLEFGADEYVIWWVRQRVPDVPTDRVSAIGVAENGDLIAGVVYSDWVRSPGGKIVDCRMHIAAESPKWCSRGRLGVFFDYPFRQIGCRRVTAIVARKNKRVRRLVEGLGWKLEGTARKAWDGRQDAMIYGMLREECRWTNGKVIEQPAASA